MLMNKELKERIINEMCVDSKGWSDLIYQIQKELRENGYLFEYKDIESKAKETFDKDVLESMIKELKIEILLDKMFFQLMKWNSKEITAKEFCSLVWSFDKTRTNQAWYSYTKSKHNELRKMKVVQNENK